jgi:hypothetical protein
MLTMSRFSIPDLLHDFRILELHHLVKMLGTLELDPVNDYLGRRQVAQYTPLLIRLAKDCALIGRIFGIAPILRIKFTNTLC